MIFRRIVAAAGTLLLCGCSAHGPRPSGEGDSSGRAGLVDAAAPNAIVTPPPPPAAASIGTLPDGPPDAMVLVPAGAFIMGADEGGEPDERPAHTATLAAYYLDLSEVTNESYGRCVEAGVCPLPDPHSADANRFGPDMRFRGPQQPVSSIGWDSASAYCAWAGKRLPTEAEWEKAARGEHGRKFPWGDELPTPARAVFGGGVTVDVATHPAGDGPYGHHDLAGNVWEWVDDVYDPYAYTRPGASSGKGGTCDEALAALAALRAQGKKGFTGSNPIPAECERVLRGGAFNYGAAGLRSSNRVHHPARFHLVMSGFRCARDAPRAEDRK